MSPDWTKSVRERNDFNGLSGGDLHEGLYGITFLIFNINRLDDVNRNRGVLHDLA